MYEGLSRGASIRGLSSIVDDLTRRRKIFRLDNVKAESEFPKPGVIHGQQKNGIKQRFL